MSQITEEVIQEHGLSPEEYQKILSILNREPNLVELGIFSVMWSEHCSYKSSRKFLSQFPTEGPQVIQGPGENAGIVDIGDGQAVAFKIESHNHPSYIEPYQGAATGVGGILRDVFTMGARPIANLNVLHFGDPDHPKTSFLLDGVVAGIAGYGNCMGIPTVAGQTVFHESYNGNILVNAMTVGLVDKDKIFLANASGIGNPVIYVGSKTGRDGIHGATMASDSFDDESEQKRPTVQVGDPFTEKRLLEACLELMQTDAIVGIQDMGAAGLSSSSFEMASRAGTGIRMNLDKIPLREEGMTPYEMMLSESQERMLMVCHKGREEEVYEIFKKWDLDAEVVGEVTDDGYLRASFQGEEVIHLPIKPLAHEAPIYDRPRKRPVNQDELQSLSLDDIPCPENLQDTFLKILSHPNCASKKWIIRQYDHQVMTNTVFLPGSDAAVIRLKGTSKALALSADINSRYCYLNPYRGGALAVAESGRNLVCSGAKPLAITDCLNYGNPENPEIMWQFEESLKGMSEACRQFDMPVVSGNVSFYNESNGKSIFPTPSVGSVGLIENIDQRLNIFFKNEGDLLVLLGESKNEIGASEYLNQIHQKVKGNTPEIDFEKEKALWSVMMQANKKSLLLSAHDLTEGGLALAACESSLNNNGLAAYIETQSSLRNDVFLFGESASRVLVSLAASSLNDLEKIAASNGLFTEVIGRVQKNQFTIKNKSQTLIDLSLDEIRGVWERGLEDRLFS